MSRIDWSKAGKRIRWSPKRPDGTNPDWDWVNRRWKDAADYAGELLPDVAVVLMADCPACERLAGQPCVDSWGRDTQHPMWQRERAAGLVRVQLLG